MKKTAKGTVATGVVAIVLLFTNCTKKGDTGPAGAPGAPGAPGNANVQVTNFTNQGFAYVSANNDYEINLTVPALTQNVFDKGAVEVYFQSTTNTTGWVSLPTTIGGVAINVAYYLNQVQLVDNTASSGLFNIKVVVIPPALRKPNVNYHNYNEVKEAHNL